MSILDDARRIQNGGAIDVNGRCYFCGFDLAGDEPHAPGCAWLAMTKIVAALEAAQAVVDMQFAAWCAHANSISDLAEAMRSEPE